MTDEAIKKELESLREENRRLKALMRRLIDRERKRNIRTVKAIDRKLIRLN